MTITPWNGSARSLPGPACVVTNRRPGPTLLRVTEVAAVVASVLLAALAAFQVALAAGAPLGRLAWGGRHRVLPTGLRIASGVSVVVYAGIGWLIWRAVEVHSDPGDHEPGYPMIWILTA